MKRHLFSRLTAFAVSAAMLPVLPLSVHAEEDAVKKNFEYYRSLSDYEVYAEYYKTYTEIGFHFDEMQDTIPTDPLDLPHYGGIHEYMTVYSPFHPQIDYYFMCNAECKLDFQEWAASQEYDASGITMPSVCWLEDRPEFFGFPEEWKSCLSVSTASSWYDPETESREKFRFRIEIVPECLAEIIPDYEEFMYQQDVFDAYRFTLTLQNSDFWKTYGCEDEFILPVDSFGDPYEFKPFFGDADRDGSIDAQDAGVILIHAAASGCSAEAAPEEIFENTGCDVTVSDVNGDETINALDVALLLRYTSAVGTGSTLSLREFVEQDAACGSYEKTE